MWSTSTADRRAPDGRRAVERVGRAVVQRDVLAEQLGHLHRVLVAHHEGPTPHADPGEQRGRRRHVRRSDQRHRHGLGTGDELGVVEEPGDLQGRAHVQHAPRQLLAELSMPVAAPAERDDAQPERRAGVDRLGVSLVGVDEAEDGDPRVGRRALGRRAVEPVRHREWHDVDRRRRPRGDHPPPLSPAADDHGVSRIGDGPVARGAALGDVGLAVAGHVVQADHDASE